MGESVKNVEAVLDFICPKCGGTLTVSGGSAICGKGHSYDKSRHGYYNLLLTSVGGVHGDNKEMVLSRRAFLGSGHYAPLSALVADLVSKYTDKCGTVLDAGCGEGYYTDEVEKSLFSRDFSTRVMAFDISKDAVRETLRKNPRIRAVVAGSYKMPIADGYVDTVINTFSPLAIDEVGRVLCQGGIFVMAIPDVDHLYELKALIYDTPYKNNPHNTEIDGFELIEDRRLSYVMHLRDREIRDLFMMTPYTYRTSRAGAMRIDGLTQLDCTADFHIFVYRKI